MAVTRRFQAEHLRTRATFDRIFLAPPRPTLEPFRLPRGPSCRFAQVHKLLLEGNRTRGQEAVSAL